MIQLEEKITSLLKERGETLSSLEAGCGVSRKTISRGIKTQTVVSAVAYYLNMDAADLVKDTTMQDRWKWPA